MLLFLPQGAPILIETDRVEFSLRGGRSRPASAGYRVWERSGLKAGLRLNLSADIDPELAQDEATVRLRSARAVVQIAKRLAEAIQAGKVVVDCDSRNGGTDDDGVAFAWWEIAWLITETGPDGFDRRAKIHAERRTAGLDKRPQIGEALVKRAQTLAENGSRFLHGTISARENKTVFYGA